MANQLAVEFLVLGNDNLMRNVDEIERKIVGTEKEVARLGKTGTSAGRELAAGFGLPMGAAAALVVGVGLLGVALNKGMTAARESADANRVLSASATEAGLAYDVATEKALKFATQTGLSNTQAKETFSSIIQVAKVAGQTDDLDNIQKRFADLAAARGVAAKDLATLSQQILSGQDEALNRLGLADPSKLAKDWADAHHTTVEAMSQSEQVASRLDAVMRKGAMFDGSAETRLASVSGQLILTEQSMANMTTAIGESIFANMEFRDALTTVNDILQSISLSSDDVTAKLNAGLTPAQIAADEASGAWAMTLDGIKNALNAIPATWVSMWDTIFSDKSFKEITDQFGVMTFGAGDRREQALRDQIEATRKALADQNKLSIEQRVFNAAKIESDKVAAAAKIANVDAAKKLAAEEAKAKENQAIIQATFKDTSTFLDDMLERVNKENPFVKLFGEADTVMERMQKRFGAFGDQFVAQMATVERSALAMELLAARMQSAQKVLDIQAEIRKLQFGLTGTSAEDDRRLGIFSKQLEAARDIPGLEASARAVREGRLPGEVDQGAVMQRQLDEIRKLKNQFTGTGYGERAAQSKINEQLIALFAGATPQQQRQLLEQGAGRDLASALEGQAQDKRQAIEDEQRRAQAARFAVEDAQKSMASAKSFGGFDNDAARGQFLSKLRGLNETELTPQMRIEGVKALEVEKKKEAAKEKQAEEDRKKLMGVIDLVGAQLKAGGVAVSIGGGGVLIEVKDTSSKASVTGPSFEATPQDQQDMRGGR